MLTLISIAFVGISLYQSLTFSSGDWLILLLATAVCLILSQYTFQIPYTKERLSTNDFAVLWAMIWVGTYGAVLLAALAVIGNFVSGKKDRIGWIMKISALSFTTFVSSTIFYTVLAAGFGFKEFPVAYSPINAFLLLSALIIGSISYLFVYSTLLDIFTRLESNRDSEITWNTRLIWLSVSTLLCVIVVFGFHLINVYFGLALGLVAVPIAIVAHFSYRFHRKTLAQKTREMSEASRVHGITVEVLGNRYRRTRSSWSRSCRSNTDLRSWDRRSDGTFNQ